MRLWVAVHTDVTHLGDRNQILQTVHHTQSGAEDGHDGELASGYHLCLGLGDGRFNGDFLQRQVTEDLIAHQHGNFVEQLPEVLGAGLAVAHDRQLMGNQRMVDNVQVAHDVLSLRSYNIQYRRGADRAPPMHTRKYYTPFFRILQELSANSRAKT